MPKRILVLATSALLLTSANPLHAGHEMLEDVKKTETPVELESWFPCDPASKVSVGALASNHLFGGYVDFLTGIYATQARDKYYFLETNTHWEDNGQLVSSVGAGFREHIPGKDIILGANVFYDSISSFRDNDYDQLGLGVEMLTHWVDFRANYYLPDNNVFLTDTYRGDTTYRRYETTIEGFDGEVGFLIPGLDRYMQVRAFAGYYHYNNPWGPEWEGFKARLEARIQPWLTAGVSYWDDTYLMGGHWTAELKVTLPFSFLCFLRGEGAFGNAQSGSFDDRLTDPIEREHRIMTAVSGLRFNDRRDSGSGPVLPPGPPGSNFIPFE